MSEFTKQTLTALQTLFPKGITSADLSAVNEMVFAVTQSQIRGKVALYRQRGQLQVLRQDFEDAQSLFDLSGMIRDMETLNTGAMASTVVDNLLKKPEALKELLMAYCSCMPLSGLYVDDPCDMLVEPDIALDMLMQAAKSACVLSEGIERRLQFLVGEMPLDAVSGTLPRMHDAIMLTMDLEDPQFVIQSDGQWHIYESEFLDGQMQADITTRQQISDIEADNTGVAYALANEPLANGDAGLTIVEKLIGRWQAVFPTVEYAGIAIPDPVLEEQARQACIANHKQRLKSLNRFVSNISGNVKDLMDRQTQLMALREQMSQIIAGPSSLAELDEQIAAIQQALTEGNGADSTGNQSVLETLVQHRQILAMSITSLPMVEAQIQDATTALDFLYNTFTSHCSDAALVHDAVGEPLLTPAEWRDLMNHIITHNQTLPIDADYNEVGYILDHFTRLEEHQNEIASNGRGSLRAGAHTLSETELRDPIDRTCYIDLNTRSSAKSFCHIMHSLVYLGSQNSTTDFSGSQYADMVLELFDDVTYKTQALATLEKFIMGRLDEHFDLSPEQADMLNGMTEIKSLRIAHRAQMSFHLTQLQQTLTVACSGTAEPSMTGMAEILMSSSSFFRPAPTSLSAEACHRILTSMSVRTATSG